MMLENWRRVFIHP